MGAHSESVGTFSEGARRFEKFFEAQLSSIGLSDNDLQNQSLAELRDSLESINDAIRSPDSFGTLHLKFDARVGLLISNVTTNSHIQIGILPLLLKKKRYVREKLRALEASEVVSTLRVELAEETDSTLQKSLSKKIDALEEEVKKWNAKSEEIARTTISESLEAEARKASIATESFERRAKVWQNFLARESVATIVGAFLVILITFSLLAYGMSSYEIPEVILNAYLITLGFFFGQGVNKASKRQASKEGTADG